ncbi:MAG: hypothetical protein WCO63_09205 [Bacteroidota bacterium]
MKFKLLFILLITVLTIGLSTISIKAIPAFSRKYKTSCVTCHAIYPKMTPFGEAFRINGYQYPKDDEDKVKEEPVSMGSESNKKVWPNSVWPSSMPGTAPFALRARSAFQVTTVDSATTSEFVMPAVQLLAAGTLGEDITVFVGAHLFENGEAGSLDRFYIKFDNLLTKWIPQHALYIQVGQFIPEMVPFATHHRGLTNSAYAMNTYDPSMGRKFVAGHVHGATTFGIENFQLGLEASGILKSRFRYVLSMVNGNGAFEDVNASKDFYGRLAYKFGGMGYDGSSKINSENPEASVVEKSVAIGVFGYKGVGTKDGIDFDFYRVGSDINIYLNKFNIIGGYINGINGTAANQKYDLYYAEVDYAMYPWLTGLLRYERANPGTLESVSQVIPHISALVVANMKFKIETVLNPEDIKFNNLYLGFEVAL